MRKRATISAVFGCRVIIALAAAVTLLVYAGHLRRRAQLIREIKSLPDAIVLFEEVPEGYWAHLVAKHFGPEALAPVQTIALESKNGNVDYSVLLNVPEVKAVRFEGAFDDSDLRCLSSAQQLVSLSLPYTTITGSGLQYLPRPEVLRDLAMVGNVTDDGLKSLKDFLSLTTLVLASPHITDQGIHSLKTIVSLQHLVIEETQLTDRGLKHLSSLTQLSMLNIMGANVSDTGVSHLTALRSLQVLNLSETNITDACAEDLATFPDLTKLYLRHCQLTEDSLGHLGKLNRLTHLDMSATQVSDAGLAHLKGLTRLKYLTLKDTKVTSKGVEELQEALPDCKIRY